MGEIKEQIISTSETLLASVEATYERKKQITIDYSVQEIMRAKEYDYEAIEHIIKSLLFNLDIIEQQRLKAYHEVIDSDVEEIAEQLFGRYVDTDN